MASLSTTICGIHCSNPFVLPSGIITETAEHQRAVEAGFGAVTLKSFTFERREGNPLPRLWKYDCGLLNSVGLRNAGIEEGTKEAGEFIKQYGGQTPIIVSLFATKIKEFLYLVEKIVPLAPAAIELNLSCPNVDDEFGKPLGMEKGAAGQIAGEVKKITGSIPVFAKLSPNVLNIAEIARACEEGGADGITAINTAGPGMLIDIKKRKPFIGAKMGGVSGPAILPIAVRCVYEIYASVKIPIIGMGGVTTVNDIVQLFMAGATLVGLGTITYTKGMKVIIELKQQLSNYMDQNNIKDIKELIGVAHG